MPTFSMGRFGEFRLIRWGLAGLVLGSGPLLLAVVIADMRGDSNSNPIGPGILAGVTFWPSLICLVIGLFKASSRG
jgi:hypothetical protein